MSLTGIILKKREDVEFDRLIHDIKLAAGRAGLMVSIDSNIHKAFRKGIYTTGNIANTYEDIPGAQQWVMYIYSDDGDGFFEYGDIHEEEHMIRVVFIDNAQDGAKIMLDFLFEYFKLNPNDYFWLDGDEGYFTYKDIKRLKQNAYDPLWCNEKLHK